MKKYEASFILRPELTEEVRGALIQEVCAVFTNLGCEVTKVWEWGLRDLAYEIAKETKGYYVVLNVNATPEAVKEFERVCNIKENIIRYLVIAD